ncbi:DNA-binding MarR family transcriptional regulator [Catalinimonas alkaloidigena]|uniref:MarR family winged helix-turn-helix transcriptional regulator n=1 Tax=Catalinimonas alkaloidigena TaxID=1075417 RepID=UPI002405ACE8|nr:MarR family transcriptional regulator [Catalinimonas alkaloidigena]MDF9797623.1 DNA-binding MarR family transcriptional regulator [Catalinimonas alkaloidigena]
MKTSPEALWLENQICFPLYAVSRMVTKLYTPLLNQLDITYPQYLVLLILWKEGQKSVTELSGSLLLETNTLTPLLKRMEKKALVQRNRSTTDERRVEVSLTPKGSALQQKAVCIPQQIFDEVHAEAMSETETLQFKATLYKLLNIFENTK